MDKPLISDVLPDFVEEMAYLLKEAGADPLIDQVRAARIDSICDCGDENCASFATSDEVKVASVVELQAIEGNLIIDLNAAEKICFIEVLGRPDIRYLIEEYYEAAKQ